MLNESMNYVSALAHTHTHRRRVTTLLQLPAVAKFNYNPHLPLTRRQSTLSPAFPLRQIFPTFCSKFSFVVFLFLHTSSFNLSSLFLVNSTLGFFSSIIFIAAAAAAQPTHAFHSDRIRYASSFC